jgi:1,4-dihydroxy-2-naphthoate octaprenyltransferase
MQERVGDPHVASGMASAPASRASAAPRWLAYARLAKWEFFDFYLSIPVVWTLLDPGLRLEGRTLLTLGLCLLAELGVVSAVMAFDDVTGYLDRSDLINYAPDSGGLRKRHRKPLLDGVLTPAQALRFGRIAAGAGGTVWLVTVVTGPHRPAWALLLAVLVLVFSVQYSWGLKLSYKGLGEVLIATSPMCIVLVPYGVITGRLTGMALTQAVLFGLWQILVSCYSNSNDIAGDAAVGRRNVATRFGATGNRIFISCLTSVELLVIAAATVTGMVPWWFPLALAGVLVLRARQLGGWLADGNALLARKRGVNIHRVGVLTLIAVNLVYPALR